MRTTFADEFDTLSLWDGKVGNWDTKFWYCAPNIDGCNLPSNGEQQWYINAGGPLAASVKPWSVADGIVTLEAKPADPVVGHPYTSGLLTSQWTFAQQYGYFEIKAQLPKGKGFWPAFWLLPADHSWPPELDVFEVLGDAMTVEYEGVHSSVGPNAGGPVPSPDMSLAMHTYGVDWEPDFCTFYRDGVQVQQVPTPPDMNKPMYMLINLAVGGSWPGNPDATTPFPGHMLVDYVRVWANRKDYLLDQAGGSSSTVRMGRDGKTYAGTGPTVYVQEECPWATNTISNFRAGYDHLDITGMVSRIPGVTLDPVAGGYLHIAVEGKDTIITVRQLGQTWRAIRLAGVTLGSDYFHTVAAFGLG